MPSTNHFKFGASGISSATRGGFKVGVVGGADYGPTSTTGFWNGVTPPVGGYVIYVDKASQGPSIHVASDNAQCIGMLLEMGATGSTIGNVLAWAAGQANMVVLSEELVIGDLPGGAPSIITSGLTLNLDAGNASSYSGTGTAWNDLSGNGYNATLVNGPTYSSSNSGIIVYGGTSNYATISSIPDSFWNGGSWTVSMWVNFDAVNRSNGGWHPELDNPLFSHGNSGGDVNNTLLVAERQGKVSFSFYANDLGGNATLSAATWYNLAFTYNNSTKLKTIYINGTYDNSAGTVGYGGTGSNTILAKYVLGGSYGNTRFAGKMAEVLFYNRTLSSGEVTTNYDAIKSRFGL